MIARLDGLSGSWLPMRWGWGVTVVVGLVAEQWWRRLFGWCSIKVREKERRAVVVMGSSGGQSRVDSE